MTLVCTVTRGQPAGVLKWSANETRLTEGREGQLDYIFVPNRYDHQKLFTCSVEHELLISPLTKSVNLDIKFKPYMVLLPLKPNFRREGTSTELCCKSKSNPSIEYATWKKFMSAVLWRTNSTRNDTDNEDQMFCLSISPLYRNSTGIYTCSAENSLGKGNSSMHLTVLYPPTVTVTYKRVEQTIQLQCKPSGEPENYTFDEWEHRSEFNELIRRIKGTHKGILALGQSNSRHHEDDGVYVCRASNGIPNSNDTIYQEGRVVITSTVFPIFPTQNKGVQFGHYGEESNLTIYIYKQDAFKSIKKHGETLNLKIKKKRVKTNDSFHGINIMVFAMEYLIHLPAASEEDFTNYTIEACNHKSCNSFIVEFKSANNPETPSNVSIKAKANNVFVTWCPGFNGGFKQNFFIEYQIENLSNWTSVGPVTGYMKNNINFTLHLASPDTFYLVRVFSRNIYGDSNKSDIVKFQIFDQTESNESSQDLKKIVSSVVIACVICLMLGIACYVKKRASSSQQSNYGSDEDFGVDNHGELVENRLYDSAEQFNLNSTRQHVVDNSDMTFVSTLSQENQIYQMQLNTSVRVNGGTKQRSQENSDISLSERQPQITEGSLNYVDVVFEPGPPTREVIIHGLQDKTNYSEIRFSGNTVIVSVSSDESDDDFIYIDGLENYLEKREKKYGEQT